MFLSFCIMFNKYVNIWQQVVHCIALCGVTMSKHGVVNTFIGVMNS